MADGGWIKLYRCLLGKAAWKCCTPEQKVVMITILLLANHEPNKWLWDGELVDVQSGQFVSSISKLSDTAGVSRQNTKTALVKLQAIQFLTYQSTRKGIFITVENWGMYQSGNGAVNQQLTDQNQRKHENLQKSNLQTNQQLTHCLTYSERAENVENTGGNDDPGEEANLQTNQQLTRHLTNNQPTANQQLTTNKNEKNEKKDKKYKERVKREKPPTDPAGIFEVSDDLELEHLGLLPETAEKTREWIRFKHERDEPVTESQLRNLVSEIKAAEKKHGAEKVCSLISQSMASGYKGIPFDRLESRPGKGRSYMDAIDGRYDVIDSWLTMAERGDFGEVGICDTG